MELKMFYIATLEMYVVKRNCQEYPLWPSKGENQIEITSDGN